MPGRIVRVYRNEDVELVIAGVPRGHFHVRFALKLKDQVIVLNEATVAGIVRAYVSTALHPFRKGIILRKSTLSKDQRKHGFAPHQLIEEQGSEEKAVKLIEEYLGDSNDKVQ